MFNVFRYPMNRESLDSWSKNLGDIAKVAILAIPVVLYSPNSWFYNISNGVLLCFCAY